MKNKRIMNAYDSINPSLSDKQRMLDAILMDAKLEEVPRKNRVDRERQVYTKKQSAIPKRQNLLAPLAAAVAIFLVAGFGISRLVSLRPSDPVLAEPPLESTHPQRTAADHYAPVLEKYRRAMAEGWTKEQCEIDGISTRMQEGNDVSRAGYALLDLDNDGREELIIAEESTDRTDNIWDLYTTLEDGTPIQLWVDEQDGGQCRLYEENVISISYSNKHELELTFYDLKSGQLVMREMLDWEDEDTVFHTDADGNTRQVTSKEGQNIGYAYGSQKLDLTWLKNISVKTQSVTGYEGYDYVVDKYITALRESWTREQCLQNDVSPQIVSNTTIQNHLGWCLKDIDQNGREELIITDGTQLFDLYTLTPEDWFSGHLIMACSEGETYQLCENGVIQLCGLYSGTTAWRYFTLDGVDLVQRDMVFYVGEENQYYYGSDDDHLSPIPKDEAVQYIDKDRTIGLMLTPFVELEPFAGDVSEHYRSLIDLYRKAIREDWNPGQCMENGISLMIGYYGELYDTLGHNQIDLNGDGNAELVITDGNNIYDLYTVISDEEVGPLRLVDATERKQYFLTTDGYIYEMGSGSAFVGYYSLYTLGQRSLVLERGYMMDAEGNPNNPWFYYDGVNKGDPCPTSEAAAITDAIRFEEISFIPFE